MPVIDSLIATACLGIVSSGSYNIACNKAAEAGTKHIGFYQDTEKVEKFAADYVNDKGQKALGKSASNVVGTTAYLVKIYRNKKVSFNVPNLGICERAAAEATPNSGSVSLKWSF